MNPSIILELQNKSIKRIDDSHLTVSYVITFIRLLVERQLRDSPTFCSVDVASDLTGLCGSGSLT